MPTFMVGFLAKLRSMRQIRQLNIFYDILNDSYCSFHAGKALIKKIQAPHMRLLNTGEIAKLNCMHLRIMR